MTNTQRPADRADSFWLEQTADHLPKDDRWLSARERAYLSRLRVPKRRSDWRLGRWTAKRAVAAYLDLPPTRELLSDIDVRASDSGAPEVYFRKETAQLVISLSHRDGTAVCALGPADALLGCDVEAIEPHSDGFVADYFTPTEQSTIVNTASSERTMFVCLIWSAKESALKALQEGLRADTRSVEVTCALRSESGATPPWQPLSLRYMSDLVFRGWWYQAGGFVRTMVGSPEAGPPKTLICSPTPSASNSRTALSCEVKNL